MAKPAGAHNQTVRLKNGGTVEVRGYGALKGKLTIAPGIDLTKPIYEQVMGNKSLKATTHKS